MQFIYTVDSNVDEPIMLIDKHIGFDSQDGMGIDGSQFCRELLALDSMGKRRVEVWINSPGGVVMDGYNICMAILNTKCKVDTYNRGMAASIAGVIFLCGRTKHMADYSILMMHDPSGGDNSKALESIKNSLATLIASRCGTSVETIFGIMSAETFLDASQSLELGACDEVETSSDANKGRLSKATNDVKTFWKEANLVLNSALDSKRQLKIFDENTNKRIMDFKKINNRLGLLDEANAESTLKAIDAIENRASQAENKASDMEKKMIKMKEEMDKAKADMEDEARKQKEAYDKMVNEYNALKKEKEESEAKAKEEAKEKAKNEAKDVITAAAHAGKIAKDEATIEKWTNRYINDPTGTKDILNDMGVSAKSPDFTVITDKDSKETDVQINGSAAIVGGAKNEVEVDQYVNSYMKKREEEIKARLKK
jgi:ATP-dependent Clp protease protease subunit